MMALLTDAHPHSHTNLKAPLKEKPDRYDSGMEVDQETRPAMDAPHYDTELSGPVSPLTYYLSERLPNETVKYINEDRLRQQFTCALCSSILQSPRQSHCGQRVCLRCIKDKFPRDGFLIECPLSHDEGYSEMNDNSDNDLADDDEDEPKQRVYTIAKDFPPDHYARNMLAEQDIYCLNKDAGCTVPVKLKLLENHIKYGCHYELIGCPNYQCRERYMRRDEEAHQRICPHAEIECPDCHETIKRSRLAYHSDNFCLLSEETGCRCGKGFPKRSELLTHREISADTRCMADYKYGERIRCGFSKYGCTFLSSSPADRSDHMSQNHTEHLEMLTIAVESIKRLVPSESEMQLVSRKLRPLEMMVGTLYQIIQTSRSKLDETEEARNSMDSMHKQLEGLRKDHEQLKRTQEASERKIETKYGQMDKIIDKLKSQLNTIKGSAGSTSGDIVQSLPASFALSPINPTATATPSGADSMPLMNGELVFTIPNFRHKVEKARNNEEISFYSPEFYTSPSGYKMKMRVYPYGDNTNKGKNLSVFFCLCKGSLDHTLEWPFPRKICFAILKPNSHEIAERPRIFVPDRGIAFARPTRDLNPSTGCPDFCALSKVDSYVSPSGDLTLLMAVAPSNTDSWYYKISNYK